MFSEHLEITGFYRTILKCHDLPWLSLSISRLTGLIGSAAHTCTGIDEYTLKELALRSFEYAVKASQAVVTQFDTATPCFFVVASGKIEAWVHGRGQTRVYERGQFFGFQKGTKPFTILGNGTILPQLREASYRGQAAKSTVVQIWLNDLAEQAPTVSVPLHDGVATVVFLLLPNLETISGFGRYEPEFS